MAVAPGHRIGQIIGDMFELAVVPPLAAFCEEHELYLDGKRERAARTAKEVRWEDDLGNEHDLDHVIERGGTETEIGIPAAFVETAWRRYTKHSKSKAQEIQAAVLPVLAKWSQVQPFAGVMLAGRFTGSSLTQLESNGFVVLHIPYETVVGVFAGFGIDVDFGEGTADSYMKKQIKKYEALGDAGQAAIGETLRTAAKDEIAEFVESLSEAILRRVESVSILPLHGETASVSDSDAAVRLLRDYSSPSKPGALVRFEVTVRYDNGDGIVADFENADDAIAFVETFD